MSEIKLSERIKNFILLLILMALFGGAMGLCYILGEANRPKIPIEQTLGCKICYPGFDCPKCRH